MEIKTITIKLPADHPIFNIPRGYRSETIRKWVDLGMDLSRVIEALESKCDVLNRIMELLETKQQAEDSPEENATNYFDMDSFIDSVSEVFRDPKEGDD